MTKEEYEEFCRAYSEMTTRVFQSLNALMETDYHGENRERVVELLLSAMNQLRQGEEALQIGRLDAPD